MFNRISQEVLHARRPTLNYISPPICEVTFSGSGFPTLILDALTGLPSITGFRVEYNPLTGRFRFSWDTYGPALCYNVYKAVDPASPNGTYTLNRSCVQDPFFDTPDCPECYLVSAVTETGETPLAGPVCSECPEPPPPGPGPPPPAVFFSSQYTATCPEEFCGETTIPAGTYTSSFSQVNADAKAIDAANAALVCEPCVLPADTYLSYPQNGPTYIHPTAAHDLEHIGGGKHGEIIIVNNRVSGTVDRLRITMLQGNPPVPAGYYEASGQNLPPGVYRSYGWTLWDYPPGNPLFWPDTDFKVEYSILGEPGSASTTPYQVAEIQTFTSDGQTLTWFIDGLPPCPCP